MSLLIRNFTRHEIRRNSLEKVMEVVFREERVKRETEISLVFTGKKRMQRLNNEYRGVDRVTDVLSFEGENDDGFVGPKDNISYLGEVFICYPQAEKQAREKGHSTQKEIEILFVHGLFHLFGYDHIKDKDYKVMKEKECEVLRRLHE